MSLRKTVVKSGQDVTKSLEEFQIVTSIDITATGDYQDESQQNWDSLVTVIGMRAQPVILSEPVEVADLSTVSGLTGAGFMFTFTTEHAGVFASYDDKYAVVDSAAVLKEILEGITLGGTEVVLDTNMEVSQVRIYND